MEGLLFGIVHVGLFDGHILEFARLEDFTAFFALDVFDVFFAGYDLHAWVLAHCLHWDSLRGSVGR